MSKVARFRVLYAIVFLVLLYFVVGPLFITSLKWLVDGEWIKGIVLLLALLIGMTGLEIVGARIILKLRKEDGVQ